VDLRAAKLWLHSRLLRTLHVEQVLRGSIAALRSEWDDRLARLELKARQCAVLRQLNVLTTRGKYFAQWVWRAIAARRPRALPVGDESRLPEAVAEAGSSPGVPVAWRVVCLRVAVTARLRLPPVADAAIEARRLRNAFRLWARFRWLCMAAEAVAVEEAARRARVTGQERASWAALTANPKR
jgi:hypothetical protein